MRKIASFLSRLLLLSLVTLERLFQIDLSTLRLVQGRRLVCDLTPQLGNHSVPIRDLRLQHFAVVTCVAYRLFERIHSRIGSAGSRPNSLLALLLANLK